MWELSKSFSFEAAHTLRKTVDPETSQRIHGHSYKAEITIAGVPDTATGLIIDLGILEGHIAPVQTRLDHQLLDDVEGIGPPTMENIARWIWYELIIGLPNLVRVTVFRESSSDRCSYTGQ